MYVVLYFVIKIYPVMRVADEQTAFVVHQAQEMDRTEQRSAHRPADMSHTISHKGPQEHDERTVTISHSLLFNNLYLFAIDLSHK